MNILIVGASSGLGRALAEALSADGHNLLLVSSDMRDLMALAQNIRLTTSGTADILACRIAPGEPWLSLLEKNVREWQPVDGVFFPIGRSDAGDRAPTPPGAVNELVEINLTSVMQIISVVLPGMIQRNKGYVVGFGSVASVRGRTANAVYAAAKRGLASYFESLRHAVAKTDVRVQFYQLGYLDTPGTFGRKLPFPKANIEKTARFIVRHMDAGFGTKTYPRFWHVLQSIVRHTPWILFKKLDF